MKKNIWALPLVIFMLGGSYFLYRARQNSIGTIFDRDVIGTWVLFLSAIFAIDIFVFRIVKDKSGGKKAGKVLIWLFVILFVLVLILRRYI